MTAPVYRVIVADDEPLLRRVIRDALVQLGHQVIGQAEDGLKVVQLACELKPDVVLMDYSMPGLDGLEAALQIREKCPCPVVLLTAYADPGMIEKAGKAGVGAYLIKPPEPDELVRALAIAIARFGDLQEMGRLNAELLVAERQRVMLQSLGAACHHLGQPATVLVNNLRVMREMQLDQVEQKKILDECLEAADRIADVLNRLQQVSEYRTVPYLSIATNESIIEV